MDPKKRMLDGMTIATAETRLPESAPDESFAPDRAGWQRLFASIDSRDASAFVAFLTADAQFRFGNAPDLMGRQAILDGVSQFFAAIGSSKHELIDNWGDNATAGCEGLVTYTRHDGSVVSFPFANIFSLRDAKISSYRIYIDSSSLFAPGP